MKKQHSNLEPDWGFDFGKIPEFEIESFEVRENVLFVTGIARSAIKLEDRLTVLRQINHDSEADFTDLAKFSLRVQSISAYHKHLNRLNAKMRAEIELKGKRDILLAALENLEDDFESYTLILRK